MTLSPILCASFVALAALALTAQGASAKSDNYKIGTAAGTTEADCTKNGGTVSTDKNGVKWCIVAATAPQTDTGIGKGSPATAPAPTPSPQ